MNAWVIIHLKTSVNNNIYKFTFFLAKSKLEKIQMDTFFFYLLIWKIMLLSFCHNKGRFAAYLVVAGSWKKSHPSSIPSSVPLLLNTRICQQSVWTKKPFGWEELTVNCFGCNLYITLFTLVYLNWNFKANI